MRRPAPLDRRWAGTGREPLPQDVGHGCEVAPADGVALGRDREHDSGLGQGVLGLGQANPIQGLSGGHGQFKRARIGQAHVLRCQDDQTPGDESRVLAGSDHRGQPVQGRVRIVAANALDERADGVVVAVAGAVVRQSPLLGGRLDVFEPGRDVPVAVADPLRVGNRNGRLRGR